ncbi:hypothetical protein BDA96_10G313700 [Sorghum bicolor]|uniref:Protein kinase domain-containing protein n=2 Tax=Sorghum bicolor TaxID=4558 RepID=A0A921U241_SORBI|nr:hypothetical protein BDA96_10G313700 [Sorghum bicolor]KXG20710.1 hypothetical protein SORBI_3010G242400 [Sorghum bicolor]
MAGLLDNSSGVWTVLGQASNVAQLVGVDALGLVSMVVQAALAARRHRDACRRLAQHVEIDMFIRLVPLIALVDSTHDRDAKQTAEGVPGLITNGSNHHVRFPRSVLDLTKIHIQGATQVCSFAEQPLAGALDFREQKSLDIEELLELCIRTQESCSGFRRFEFFQIIDATDNFSESRKIGWGGFGTVYKGQLPDGSMIAIKRMDENATVFDFSSEFLLARLQHTNLIRLLGWCIHGKERILVYEFMHKGSLHHFIFDKRMGSLLDWSKRINIIKGLAEGLVYLHKQSKLWIVHRDLKPKNILLDHDMNPKIADFGSARTLSSDFAEECTSRVVGTSGYKAPEYTSRGVYSLKTDVFSFGVMVLVTISGRKNTILENQGDSVGTLVRDAWQLWNDGRLQELVDPMLGDEFELAEVMQYAQVALLCAQEESTDRPTMSDVVSLLNFQSISLLPDPKQPSELCKGGATGDKLSTYVSQSSRTIDITITSSAPISTRVRITVDPETSK